MENEKRYYKWYLLFLVIVTNMLVVAIPVMGMSVLAKEISQDLHLDLVQVGIVWGVGALPGIVTGLLGGAIGDKIGPKRIMIAGCLLAGLVGAARGLAVDFLSMVVVVMVGGALAPVLVMNGMKTCGMWFPAQQLGLANGLISMGMALGFLLGAMFSATTLSPLLGGWRNVLILYGLAGAGLALPWVFTRAVQLSHQTAQPQVSIRETVIRVAHLKDIWLLGLVLFGVGGAIQGMLGYLPLYLRDLGWEPLRADGTLTAFHTISMVFVLPIAIWSDRLKSRKSLLFVAGLMVALGAGLLTFAQGGLVWIAVLIAGFVRDGFMAIYMTMIIETEGIGPTYVGTATGFATGISGLGMVLAPPLGNSLAVLWPGAPFTFWSVLTLAGLACLALVKRGQRAPEPVMAVGPL
ncbi:MAG TPA: MFS transporter [Anaerolineales bacterium]|nr:MFS transporter [Anaerolineales bacterium]